MSSGIEFTETPESRATRMAVESLVILAPESCRKALRTIIGRQLRDTIGSWRKKATPGGEPWAPNAPEYADWKVRVLGQRPVQVGVVTGDLRQSISSDINEAALEGRVGSPIEYAGYFAGEDINEKSRASRKARRFLPTTAKATRDAQAITEHTLRQTIQQTGLRVAMAGGLGLEDFL